MDKRLPLLFMTIFFQLSTPQFGWANEVDASNQPVNKDGEILAMDKGGQEPFQMDEVVITATRILQDARKVPASITVITAQQIKEMNIMTVDEALRNSAGIFVDRPKGISGVSGGIMMRGFSGNNILALIDGQPMNIAYDGAINWNAIPIENIERIEVVRGSGSSLYGGHAVGGVINIITKEPQETAISTNVSYGSDKTWRKSLNVNQKISDKLSIGAGYENRSTDGHVAKPASTTSAPSKGKKGIVPKDKPQGTGVVIGQTVGGSTRYIFGDTGNNAYDGDTSWFKMKYKFDQDKALSYNYTHDTFEYRYDHPTTFIHDAAGRPIYDGYAVLPDGRYFTLGEGDFTDNLGYRTADIHALRYEDAKNNITLNAGFSDTSENGYSNGDSFDKSQPGSNSSYPSKTWNVDLQKAWKNLGKHTMVAGVNWRNDEMTQTVSNLAHWGDHQSITKVNAISSGKDQIAALFVQDEYQMNDQWKLFGGLRYDTYKKYDGYSKEFKNKGSEKSFSEYTYHELSPKVAVEYQQDPNTTYYASYGHSFNPPPLYQLYRWTTGSSYDSPSNPNLKPETSDTFEIGIKKDFNKKTNMNVALYQTKTKDMIARVTYQKGEYLPNPGKMSKVYENLESATRKGIEVDLTHKINSKWDVYTNYAWQKGSWDSSQGVITDIPTHLLHFGGNYHYKKVKVNLDAMYVSERNDDDAITGVYGSGDGYFTVNARLNYAITSNTTIAFGVDNLFNREIYSYYAAGGRTYNLGVQYNF